MQVEPRIVVLANAWDSSARDFVARHRSAGLVLLVPGDLSQPGWRFRLADPAATIWVAGTRPLRLDEIGCVLTRLTAVTPADLPHIVAHDRDYVAAEMTAFLLAMLSQPGLRVVNRPTPQCLCGPAWHDAAWRAAAGRLGLPVAPYRAWAELGRDREPTQPAGAIVTTVGDLCPGAPDAALARAARALADHAEAEILAVAFDGTVPGAAILRADPRADLDDPPVRAAVLKHLGVTGPVCQARVRDPALGH